MLSRITERTSVRRNEADSSPGRPAHNYLLS